MNIEDLKCNIGNAYLEVNNEKIYWENDFIENAVYDLYFALNKMENNINSIYNNNFKSIIALIYIALENYMGALLRALSELDTNINYGELKTKKILYRLEILTNSLGNNYQDICQETNIENEISEFAVFRNAMFHGKRDNGMTYNFCKFKNDIEDIKIEDAIEALKIYINFCRVFSKSINGLNLMPNIIIYKEDTFFFERVDNFFEKIIVEQYKKILNKYSINTDYKFEIKEYYNWNTQNYNVNQIVMKIKASGGNYIKISNPTETNFGKELYKKIADAKETSKGMFYLPNYMDNN